MTHYYSNWAKIWFSVQTEEVCMLVWSYGGRTLYEIVREFPWADKPMRENYFDVQEAIDRLTEIAEWSLDNI